MFSTYYLLTNHSPVACDLQVKIEDFLRSHRLHLDELAPNLVFCLGGDGTFLKAFQKYVHRLKQTIFIPVRAGEVGFYCSFDAMKIDRLFAVVRKFQANWVLEKSILELNYGAHRYFAINEFKVIDHVGLINTDLFIDDEHLETFRGSGFVFSSASGATGYARTINGAILLDDNMWQLQELAPVNHVKFGTVRSPLILSRSNSVRLTGNLRGQLLVHDNLSHEIDCDNLKFKLSTIKCQILFDPQQHISVLGKIKSFFLPGHEI